MRVTSRGGPPTQRASRAARRSALAVLGLGAVLGCVAGKPEQKPLHDSISIFSPRCAGLRSCVVGHVTAPDTATPVAEAAVFLIRELEPGEDEPVRILALTDEQGVFVVDDPPIGSYRIAVYKDASHVEVIGMELGGPGTTMLLVRLTD
jgi:hypothetical protein